MRVHSRQHLLLAGLALCGFVAACLWLAGEWRDWPGVMIERAIKQQEPVATDKLLAFWEPNKEMGSPALPGRNPHLAGLAGYTLAQDTSLAVFQRAEMLLQAEQLTRAALSREPADARAWARLAWLLDSRKGPTDQLLAALRMSLYCAPADVHLVFWRLRSAATYRSAWDADLESLLARQVILGWRVSPARLAKVAKAGALQDWMRTVLHDHGADTDQFDARLRKS